MELAQKKPEPGDEIQEGLGEEIIIEEGIHPTLRAGERNIESREVIRHAQDIYYDENGNQVYVWHQGDGTSEITIRDPSNGRVVTNQRSTDGWVKRQVTKPRSTDQLGLFRGVST